MNSFQPKRNSDNGNELSSNHGLASRQKLDLSQNRIQAEHVTFLSEVLPTDDVIQELQLYNNQTTKCVGAMVLATSLQQNSTVKHVNLINNNIGQTGVRALADALKINKTIQVLHLSGNHFGSAGVVSLISALQVNTTLQVLSLDGCSICLRGTRALARMLSKNHPSLKELRLRGNLDGSIVEAHELAEALKTNTTLDKLLVGFTRHVISESIGVLRRAMKYNISITHLLVMENHSKKYVRSRRLERILKDNRFRKQASDLDVVPCGLLPFMLTKPVRHCTVYSILRRRAASVVEGRAWKNQS